MAGTTYSDAGVTSRTESYAYGAGRRKNGMPYAPRQARAVLANTSETNPRHREARAHAKSALSKKKSKGLLPASERSNM